MPCRLGKTTLPSASSPLPAKHSSVSRSRAASWLPPWEKRLAGLQEEFHRHYQAAREEETRAALERKIVSLESLSRFALPILTRLSTLPVRASWGDWINALVDLAEFTLRDAERVV